MNKQAIANTLKSLQKTMRKHSPAILTGIGIAGMAAAAVKMCIRDSGTAYYGEQNQEVDIMNKQKWTEKPITLSLIHI